MSKLAELLAEHCPDGVEFRRVGDVTGKGANICWADAGGQEFEYIDLSSVDRSTRRIGETATISAGEAPSRAQQIVRTGDVIFATTRPTQMRWAIIPAEFDGQIVSTGYCVLRPKSNVISTSFLAHLLGAEPFRRYLEENQVQGNYPAISDRVVREFKIPVPPLVIQLEIAAILDTVQGLKAELEAELEGRTRQYAFYRDQLLTLREAEGIRWVPMGELTTIARGASPRPIQAFLTEAEDGVPWIKIGDVPASGKFITNTAQRLTAAGAKKSRRIYPGDFVLSNSMSFGRPYIAKIEGCIHDGWLSISHFEESFIPDFLYHLLRSSTIQLEFARRAGSGTVQNLNADIVKSVMIPVPSLEEQERIVRILDKFDALVNDLAVGLPAEIAARRKQYEYYRHKLLTFEETA